MIKSFQTYVANASESKSYKVLYETTIDVLHLLRAIPRSLSSSEYKQLLRVLKNAEKSKGKIEIPHDSMLNRDLVEQMLRSRREGMFFLTWDLTKLNYLYGFLMVYFTIQFYQLMSVENYRKAQNSSELDHRSDFPDDYEENTRHRVRN